MSAPLHAAMEALERVLEAETAAIAARDLAGAAAFAAEKAGAVDAFLRARAALAPRQIEADRGAIAITLDRLRQAAARNRAALERGIALQGRVIEAIARGARRTEAAAAPGYARPAKPCPSSLAVSVSA